MINKFFYKDYEKYKVDLTLDHIKQVQDKIKLRFFKNILKSYRFHLMILKMKRIFKKLPVFIFRKNDGRKDIVIAQAIAMAEVAEVFK